jgi:hypothetical protein
MKKIALSVLTLVALQSMPALAADPSGGAKSQTNRMSQCSSAAKEMGLKGEARREHMSQCLRAPGSRTAARECNATAKEKGLKGTRRKEFVNDCIKSKAAGDTVG